MEEQQEPCLHEDTANKRWKDLHYETKTEDHYATIRIEFCVVCGKILNHEID